MANLSLIERLNMHLDLPPDEIVKKIRTRGWIKGSDMTAEIVADWGDRRVCVGEWERHSNRWWPTGLTHPGRWRADTWSLDILHRSLSNICFILEEDHNHGEPPPNDFIPVGD